VVCKPISSFCRRRLCSWDWLDGKQAQAHFFSSGHADSQHQTRHLEAFGRKVTTTAGHLIGPLSDPAIGSHYQNAISDIHRELRRPAVQRRILALAQTTPTDLVRSRLSTSEIQSRALSALPAQLLKNIPEDTSTYSLFQGFKASLPDSNNEHRKSHRRRSSRGQRLLGEAERGNALPQSVGGLKRERQVLHHRMEMMNIRKNMCSAEIHEIDNKMTNLTNMRKIVLDRLAGLEMDEADLDHACEFFFLFFSGLFFFLMLNSGRARKQARGYGRRNGRGSCDGDNSKTRRTQ
jgi:hypothetical protein